MSEKCHLSQLNIARALAPMDSETMSGFMARLDEINAIADDAPGFVWRLQTEDGDATALRPYPGEDLMLVNMSVWESVDALFQYTYATDHIEVMRQRRKWFEHMEVAFFCLWYIPIGHIPTVDEAKARLAYMREHGATPYAFTFKQRFTIEDMQTYTLETKS
ncbi:MAG: DUF3291 domain-containing protein [Aggregatilineales bacterium]